jgi:hypothetical protein
VLTVNGWVVVGVAVVVAVDGVVPVHQGVGVAGEVCSSSPSQFTYM